MATYAVHKLKKCNTPIHTHRWPLTNLSMTTFKCPHYCPSIKPQRNWGGRANQKILSLFFFWHFRHRQSLDSEKNCDGAHYSVLITALTSFLGPVWLFTIINHEWAHPESQNKFIECCTWATFMYHSSMKISTFENWSSETKCTFP